MQRRLRVPKPMFLSLAGILTLAVAVGALANSRQSASGDSGRRLSVGAPAPESAAPDVLPAKSVLQADGGAVTVTPAPANQPSKLGPTNAYQAYVEFSGGKAGYGTAAEYQYGLFTDNSLQDPSASGAYVVRYRDVPAWAVVFRNVMVQPGGKVSTGPVRSDVVFIVSDATGKVLEELDGPIALKTS